MKTNEWLAKHEFLPNSRIVRYRAKCADGMTLSLQVSDGHYCSPRDDAGPWNEVEIGYPSRKPPKSIMHYIDGLGSEPTKAVYGYVPVKLVDRWIARHGGIVGPLLPESNS